MVALNLLNPLKTMYTRTRLRVGVSESPPASKIEQRHLRELSHNGYSVIERWQRREQCTQLIAEIERVFTDHSARIWSDATASDRRAYGADRVSASIRSFARNDFIERMAELYVGLDQRCFFTLANKVVAASDNLGSGGGWHRDNPHRRQFKAILYLSDVGADNGPFQYVPGSHQTGFTMRTLLRGDIKHGQSRYTPDQLESVVRSTGVRPHTFTARAGTLILVDTSGVHRGAPIEQGSRYALTNYIFNGPTIRDMQSRGKFTKYFVDRVD